MSSWAAHKAIQKAVGYPCNIPATIALTKRILLNWLSLKLSVFPDGQDCWLLFSHSNLHSSLDSWENASRVVLSWFFHVLWPSTSGTQSIKSLCCLRRFWNPWPTTWRWISQIWHQYTWRKICHLNFLNLHLNNVFTSLCSHCRHPEHFCLPKLKLRTL